jgi:hypothetical protein
LPFLDVEHGAGKHPAAGELPNAQTRIAALRDCQRHPSSCPCILGYAVRTASGGLLEPSSLDVLLSDLGQRAAILGALVFHVAVANIRQAAVDCIMQLPGERLEL